METSSKTIIHHYTNFIMMTPVALTAPTMDKGVSRMVSSISWQNALDMFDSVEEMFAKIKRAFPNQITPHDRSKLSQASKARR